VSLQNVVRSVRKVVLLSVVLTVLFASLTSGAQDALARKVKSKIPPSYPDIARKMNLAGIVKLEVTVAPNGTVKDTKVIGGNPILVNAAVDAVKRWRFEPANEDSVGLVEFKFDPSN
jgi:TonB family protein